MKVSKRKAEAKIREIAVYEFRPQFHKRKLWYVNDTTLEKLNLSLPVPTEWKWITLALAECNEANSSSLAKQSVSVTSAQPSPTTANGTIKSFMSSTPYGSHQQSPARNSVNKTKDSFGVCQSLSQDLQQSTPVSATKIKSINSASPACASVVCDNGMAMAMAGSSKVGSPVAVQPLSTPCSSSTAKKRKVQSDRRHSLPMKQQSCLLFSKKPQQPANGDNDCIVIDSCMINVDNAISSADKRHAQPSDSGMVSQVKTMAQQPADDDCMIVDSYVVNSESGTKLDADVRMISDEKSLPETDANCNLCTESSVNDTKKPVETTVDVDN